MLIGSWALNQKLEISEIMALAERLSQKRWLPAVVHTLQRNLGIKTH